MYGIIMVGDCKVFLLVLGVRMGVRARYVWLYEVLLGGM